MSLWGPFLFGSPQGISRSVSKMGTLGNIILPCPVIILYGPKFDPKSLELHESFFVLQNCDLSGCDLQEANLRGSNVKGAIFEEMLTPLHMSQSVR